MFKSRVQIIGLYLKFVKHIIKSVQNNDTVMTCKRQNSNWNLCKTHCNNKRIDLSSINMFFSPVTLESGFGQKIIAKSIIIDDLNSPN